MNRDVYGPHEVARWRGSWSVLYPTYWPYRSWGNGTPIETSFENAVAESAASTSAMSPCMLPPAWSVRAISTTESGASPASVSL